MDVFLSFLNLKSKYTATATAELVEGTVYLRELVVAPLALRLKTTELVVATATATEMKTVTTEATTEMKTVATEAATEMETVATATTEMEMVAMATTALRA